MALDALETVGPDEPVPDFGVLDREWRRDVVSRDRIRVVKKSGKIVDRRPKDGHPDLHGRTHGRSFEDGPDPVFVQFVADTGEIRGQPPLITEIRAAREEWIQIGGGAPDPVSHMTGVAVEPEHRMVDGGLSRKWRLESTHIVEHGIERRTGRIIEPVVGKSTRHLGFEASAT